MIAAARGKGKRAPFQRVPVMENLGLALLGVAYAVLAEQYWKPDEQRLKALYEHWTPRIKDGGDWPQEVHEARRTYDAVRSHVFAALLKPVSMYIMRCEVFAICEVSQ